MATELNSTRYDPDLCIGCGEPLESLGKPSLGVDVVRCNNPKCLMGPNGDKIEVPQVIPPAAHDDFWRDYRKAMAQDISQVFGIPPELLHSAGTPPPVNDPQEPDTERDWTDFISDLAVEDDWDDQDAGDYGDGDLSFLYEDEDVEPFDEEEDFSD